jgi:hypothetical protein
MEAHFLVEISVVGAWPTEHAQAMAQAVEKRHPR